MTKADLIETVYRTIGFTKKESAEIVEMVFEIMKENLSNGENVKLSGFGNFVVRKKKPRIGRNPQTGEEMTISERRVLSFKPSPILRKLLNTKENMEAARANESMAMGVVSDKMH